MSQASVLALINELSNGQADLTLAPTFYIDAVNELADKLYLTTTALAGFTAGQTELTIPATVRQLMKVVYNDAELSDMTLRQLEAVDYRWRDREGKPRGYTTETETAKTIALFPTPDVSSAPYSGSLPPLGLGYPQFNGVLLYSGFRDPVPFQLEIVIVAWILEREYSRESDHQNGDMSEFWANMKDLFYAMLEY